MNVFVKYTDDDCVTSYHWLGRDFSFEVDLVSANLFVSFNRINSDDSVDRVVEVEIDYELEDIHDYLVLISDGGDEFTDKVYETVIEMVEDAIDEFISSGQTVLDLNVVTYEISKKMSQIGMEFVRKFNNTVSDAKATV